MNKNLMTFAAMTGVLAAAGCSSDRGTDPELMGDSWSLARFHVGGEEGAYQDLSLQPSGGLWLEEQEAGWGGASSARGLLAGERLETLARVIDDLPLHSYSPDTDCETPGFFVSVTRNGEVLSYSSNDCDLGKAPSSLNEAHAEFGRIVEEVRGHRTEGEVPFDVLAMGASSAITAPQRRIVRNVSELITLLQQHSPNRPVAIPQVDFEHQTVVARFLGEKPSGGYGLRVDSVLKSLEGWLSLQFVAQEPGGDCANSAAPTQPFVIVALEKTSTGLLFETEVQLDRCE